VKITVDCRMLDSSGIGVYLRGCLPWFLQSGHDFLLLGKAEQLQSFSQKNACEIIECNTGPFSLKELFFFPSKISRIINETDAYFTPFFNVPCCIEIPVYTVIHDIIFPDMPELISRAGLAARMWFYRRAYIKSKKIFTVSEFSKSRIEYHLGKEKPVIVTHSAIRPQFINYRLGHSGIAKKKTVVFIGNIKKHKGLDCLLEAFQTAVSGGLPHKLIIIGSRENFRSRDKAVLSKINSLGEETVSFTGLITDDRLMELVSSAELLVQPSLYEGFCLPPLEALTLGTSVLISDIPVLKEIYSVFPVSFFKAGDSSDLKEKMTTLLSSGIPPVELSDELLSKYTFEKTAAVIMREIEG